MTDLTELPPEERVRRFRAFAHDAEQWAKKTRGQEQTAYEAIAAQWRKLADDIEARSVGPTGN